MSKQGFNSGKINRIQWFRETLGLAKINARKGTHNCAHCALRLDDYIREGGAEEPIKPVPKRFSGLFFNTTTIHDMQDRPLKVIRSSTNDPRILDRCASPKVTSDTAIIYDLTQDEMEDPILDLTWADESHEPQKKRCN